jgi:predicted pyridoxine 5'-phosphate oxidase superfamily flavin-nucleotide-binding protein
MLEVFNDLKFILSGIIELPSIYIFNHIYMSLSTKVIETINIASAKALATNGPEDINVVPVSMIKVNSDSIWLFDFFMDKTVANLKQDKTVALTTWTDMVGIQIKAKAEYLTEGENFDQAVAWVATQNPDRVVKGLIILEPTAIYDISPGGAFTENDLAIGS